MIISSKKDLSKSILSINGVGLTMESSVKLLGIEIDNKLNFEKRISNICRKTSNQLNAICRLETFMAQKKAIINTFVLFGTSVLKRPKIKWKKFVEGV